MPATKTRSTAFLEKDPLDVTARDFEVVVDNGYPINRTDLNSLQRYVDIQIYTK
jgi:hypothetical protein